MKNKVKWINNLLFLLGIVLILNSSLRTITGNVVNENFQIGNSIFGVIFIVLGIVLFLAEKRGKLEEKVRIFTTKKFEKETKKHPKKEIDRAIKKIKEGLGKQEHLKYLEGYSIRTSKGARILYERKGNEVYLTGYNPSSKHH